MHLGPAASARLAFAQGVGADDAWSRGSWHHLRVAVHVPRRQIVGLLFAVLAVALASLAAWSAASVEYCPRAGRCSWSPWLGIPAVLIGILALVACWRFVRWAQRGTGGDQAAAWLGAAVAFGGLWFIAFVVTLTATA